MSISASDKISERQTKRSQKEAKRKPKGKPVGKPATLENTGLTNNGPCYIILLLQNKFKGYKLTYNNRFATILFIVL